MNPCGMAPKHSRLPSAAFQARVEALAHDGRGIAHRDGKTVFIDGALPGEEVLFKFTTRHSQYDEGEVMEILAPSPDRVQPRCPHFGVCGGCSLQYLRADRQIAYKQDWLLANLSRIGKVKPERVLEPLTGPWWGYRRKARLSIKAVAKKGRVVVGFRERRGTYVADLHRCEILHPPLGELLEELAVLIDGLSIRDRLPQVEVAIGDAAVALSFRVLSPPRTDDEAKLSAFGQHHGFEIYLQSKGPETTYLLWPERAGLSYRLPSHDLELAFAPYHFIQVNADINRQMVDRVVTLLELQEDKKVLDLFCGLGNFTLPLARKVRFVTGVEGEPSLVAWARRNALHNGIHNVHFIAADLTADLAGQPWTQQRYDKILLDPPRSGALQVIPQIAACRPRRIAYISCHPATLARDAGELVYRFGYALIGAGVMDMFPHTAHVESLALFERRS